MKGKKLWSRALALLLTGALGIGLLPAQAMAYWAGEPEDLTIVGQDGKEITVTDDWETTFPYGTFAFGNFQAVAEEGGDTAVIQVYRLGGTEGRAVAYISYEPVLTQMEDGSAGTATAAGSEDVIIEAEDPLPGALDQPIGQPEQPEEPKKAVSVEQSQAEDGVLLSIDVEAEAYQWYVLYADGWELISNATGREMLVDEEELAEYDFRCVYTVDGVAYGSDSLLGVPYEAEPEAEPETEPEPEPAGEEELVNLNPDPTFTRINEENPENPYLGYVFDLTFADGEWVKEIRVTVPEDREAEALKFGTFTIVDHLGASLYDTANTLTLQVVDNDAPEESRLGFAVTEVRADKAAGTAEITVRRTGGNQSMLTIDYATQDGTALAGVDYAAASGTLTFYGDLDEQDAAPFQVGEKHPDHRVGHEDDTKDDHDRAGNDAQAETPRVTGHIRDALHELCIRHVKIH